MTTQLTIAMLLLMATYISGMLMGSIPNGQIGGWKAVVSILIFVGSGGTLFSMVACVIKF